MTPKIASEKWTTASQSLINAEYLVKTISGAVSHENISSLGNVIAIEILSTVGPSNIIEKYLKGDSVYVSLTDENQTGNVTDFLSALGE